MTQRNAVINRCPPFFGRTLIFILFETFRPFVRIYYLPVFSYILEEK